MRIISVTLSLLLTFSYGSLFSLKADAADVGTTYYVDNTSGVGSDSNSGKSPDTPWATLGKVNGTAFQPGDQILFKSGDSWHGELKITRSGSAAGQIVYGKYGGDAKPVINGDGGHDAILLANAQYTTVEDLEVTNYNPSDPDDYKTAYYRRYGIWLQAYNRGVVKGTRVIGCDIHDVTGVSGNAWLQTPGGEWVNKYSNAAIGVDAWDWADGASNHQLAYYDDLRIQDNNIHDIYTMGIYTGGNLGLYNQGVVVAGNTVNRTGDDGILVGGSENPLIEHNKVYDCAVNGTDYQYIAALWVASCKGAVIQYNEVARTHYENSYTSDSAAFDIDNDCTGDFYFQYNYSHENAGGFFMDMGNLNGNAYIRYNISQNDAHNGYSGCTMNITGANYNIYNNVFYNNTDDGFTIREDTGADYQNNIFYVTSVGTPYPSSVRFENNDFFGNGAPAQGVGNETADPGFTDPGKGADGMDTVSGYQLKADSPMLGEGLAIPGNGGTDYWGNALYAGDPEIGAYESPTDTKTTTESPAAPTDLTVAGVTDTSVSLSWNASKDGVPLSADVYDADTGALAASTIMRSNCTITGLKASTSYRFYVVAKDKVGNRSEASGTITVQTNQAAIVLDNTAAVTAGAWSSVSATDAYGGNYLSAPAGTGSGSVTWPPELPADGYYAVSYWLPAGSGLSADDASFTVSYSGGQKTYRVNEALATGQWVRLGIHYFKAGSGESVTLTDQADGKVAADAIRFDYESNLSPDTIVNASLVPQTIQTPVGGTIDVDVMGGDSQGRMLDLKGEGAQIAYQSSNTAVATFEDGVVTGVAPGTVDLSASVTIDGKTVATPAVQVFIGSDFTVCPPVYSDSAGKAVTSLAPRSVVNVSELIVNSTDESRPVSFIAALYSPDGMVQEKSADAAVRSMDHATVSVSLNLPEDTGCYIKTFVLDSKDSMHPLSDTSIFPAPDKTALNDAIAQADAFNLKKYTQDSADALGTALTAAKAVAESGSATQGEVDTATQALTAAIANLETNVNKTKLKAAIARAESLDLTKYTDASAEALQTALAAAQSVESNKTPTQCEVDAAARRLNAAMARLVKKPDKTRLEAAIAKASAIDLSKYTASSAKAVKRTLAAAKDVDQNAKASQCEIDAATKLLETAVKKLVLQPKPKSHGK